MKNKLSIITAALLAVSCLPVHAGAYVAFDGIVRSYYNCSNDTYTVETEQFKYHPDYYGMHLETDLLSDTSHIFMVTGVFYRNEEDTEPYFYSITPVGDGQRGNLVAKNVTTALDGKNLAIGDLFEVTWLDSVEITPVEYHYFQTTDFSGEENPLNYLGNGMELFGDEFLKVMRHELIVNGIFENQFYSNDTSGIDIYTGDVTEDEEINLLDVITLNKAMFGKVSLNDYAAAAADINKDGKPDASDSLSIMRYIVKLDETLG